MFVWQNEIRKGIRELNKSKRMKMACSTIQFRCNSLRWIFIFEMLLQPFMRATFCIETPKNSIRSDSWQNG